MALIGGSQQGYVDFRFSHDLIVTVQTGDGEQFEIRVSPKEAARWMTMLSEEWAAAGTQWPQRWAFPWTETEPRLSASSPS